jgi:hypothetical protein
MGKDKMISQGTLSPEPPTIMEISPFVSIIFHEIDLSLFDSLRKRRLNSRFKETRIPSDFLAKTVMLWPPCRFHSVWPNFFIYYISSIDIVIYQNVFIYV